MKVRHEQTCILSRLARFQLNAPETTSARNLPRQTLEPRVEPYFCPLEEVPQPIGLECIHPGCRIHEPRRVNRTVRERERDKQRKGSCNTDLGHSMLHPPTRPGTEPNHPPALDLAKL